MAELPYIQFLSNSVVIILAFALIFYSYLLLKRLKSKDLAVSMIFLHEKEIKNVFLVLVFSSFLFFLAMSYYVLYADETSTLILRIVAIIYSFSLLYFAYKLQKVLKGGESQ